MLKDINYLVQSSPTAPLAARLQVWHVLQLLERRGFVLEIPVIKDAAPVPVKPSGLHRARPKFWSVWPFPLLLGTIVAVLGDARFKASERLYHVGRGLDELN